MAGEEVFIASAIHSVGAIVVFLVMYFFAQKQGSNFWSNVWLMAIFLVLTYDFTVQRVAFNAIGTYDLRELAFSFLQVIMWMVVAIFGVLIMNFVFSIFKSLYKAATGSGYDEKKGGDIL